MDLVLREAVKSRDYTTMQRRIAYMGFISQHPVFKLGFRHFLRTKSVLSASHMYKCMAFPRIAQQK